MAEMDNADGNTYVCNMCCFSTDNFISFKTHTVRYHKDDPNFMVVCSVGSCSYTTNNWNTFRSHISRKHKLVHSDEDDHILDVTDELQVPFDDQNALKTMNAQYTLSLQVEHNLSENAIDKVVQSTNLLMENQTVFLKKLIKVELSSRNIDSQFLDEINTCHMFDEIDTAHKREKFYSDCPSLPFVKPEEVLLGKQYVSKGNKLVEKQLIGYYVPFEKALENLLNLPEVWEHVNTPHFSGDEFMYDVCDGDYIRNNPLFQRNPNAIQVILNTDDLEIVNPLGTHTKKHKISIFYFTLANIPPQYRSKLSVIQLVAIGKTKDVRQQDGLDKLLDNFVSSVNLLSSKGIDMCINGDVKKIEGALVLVPADTLAANWLGKFKEGVSFAFKNCRMCDVTGVDIKNIVREQECTLRTDESHAERCELLSNLSKGARYYWSKMWGINDRSCLMSLSNFSITAGLVQDPMHVFLEGIVPREVGSLLFYLVNSKKLFSLRWLNEQILKFPFSYLHEYSKPEATFTIGSLEDGTCVRQSSSAMLTLCYILPLIIGPKIPEGDEFLLNFLRLVQIVILCTSTYCTRETASILKIFVAIYLSKSKQLYPKSSFIPKKHFILHLPRQILLYGPLRHHWCMRFEAKHGFFKSKKIRNFKNLPYTLSKYHQLYMCHKQAGSNGEPSQNFLYEGDIVRLGSEINFSVEYAGLKEQMEILSQTESENEWFMYRTKSVTIQGLRYEVGCAVVMEYVEDTPVFAILKDIIVYKADKYFVFETTHRPALFDKHVLHYILEPTGRQSLTMFKSLKFRWPLSVYKYRGMLVIMNVNTHSCEIF